MSDRVLESRLKQVRPRALTPRPHVRRLDLLDHALREFRKKFPRYTQGIGEGDLFEDLRLFVDTSCVESSTGARSVLISHLPIWNRMRVVLEKEKDRHVLVTVFEKKSSETDWLRRVSYTLRLAQQLINMGWSEMSRGLLRFEHSGGRSGWGFLLARVDGGRNLVSYMSVHELLDFWAARNHYGETLYGRCLEYLAQRMSVPACLGISNDLESLRQGVSNHGIWASSPNPDFLRLEISQAMSRRHSF